jgi:hypothetical protein
MQGWTCRTFALALPVLLASSISPAAQEFTCCGICHRSEASSEAANSVIHGDERTILKCRRR